MSASPEIRTVKCQNGTRISTTSLCDGIRDCADLSDENYLGRGFKCELRNDKRCDQQRYYVRGLDKE